MGSVCSNLCGFGSTGEEPYSFPIQVYNKIKGSTKIETPQSSVAESPLKIKCQSPIISRKSTLNGKSNLSTRKISSRSVYFGEKHKDLQCIQKEKTKLSIEDFSYHGHLGKSKYGKQIKATKKSDNTLHAVKILKKEHINFYRSIKDVVSEKTILQHANSPFIVKLKYCFQDNLNLYSCMEYVPGGRLSDYLTSFKRFPESVAQFYAVEVILALDYIHGELDTIYRDLRPENILLDEIGHCKLKDFGLSKIGVEIARNCGGNSEYLAPEILDRKDYGKFIDFWAQGCFIFEILNGYKAFNESNENIMFALIKKGSFKEIQPEISETAIDQIKGLLQIDPNERLGAQGISQIKKHKFFDGVNWGRMANKEFEPPIQPDISNELSEKENVDISLKDSHVGNPECIIDVVDWSYTDMVQKGQESQK